MALPQIRSGLPWGNMVVTLINNAIAKIVDASTTVAGLVKLASNADTVTGTATDTATTPAGVKAATDAVITALKAAANTWADTQTIAITALGNALVLRATEDSATEAQLMVLERVSSSPATFDFLSGIRIRGRDSAGNAEEYVGFFFQIIDPTSGSEDSRLYVRTRNAGADADWYFQSGALRYSTQTQPSNAGEIAAVAYKVGANQVVGARKTGWALPTGTSSRATFDTSTVTTAALAQRVKALIEDLEATAGHGLIGS